MAERRSAGLPDRIEPTARIWPDVEFVCTGNICRSPFASAVAIGLGVPKDAVHSSGLWADPGRRCPPEAIDAAAEQGVDLSRHGAHPTEAAALRRRGWVLTMEYGQLRQVQSLLPAGWGGQVALLGTFCSGAGVEIPDPYGASSQQYRVVYRLIREAVGNWLSAWQGLA